MCSSDLRFLEIDGIRWHYQQQGNGPVVLLVHGAGGSTHSWAGCATALSASFTVISTDLPGHGFTFVPPAVERARNVYTIDGMARALQQLLDALQARARDQIRILLAGATLGLAAPVTENWENHCTKCHGEDGKGQTKVGKKLQAKDYTDAKVQAEMKDADMIKATLEGVFDKAGKERMKAYKDELSADEVKALVAYIRKFKA